MKECDDCETKKWYIDGEKTKSKDSYRLICANCGYVTYI